MTNGIFKDDYTKALVLSTVPLRNLNQKRIPEAVGSGCIGEYRKLRFLLTVEHVVGEPGDWVVEVCYDQTQRRTIVYRLGPMMFLSEADVTSGAHHLVDFSYAVVPRDLTPLYQELAEDGSVAHEEPRRILCFDPKAAPTRDRTFGFAGLTRPSIEGKCFVSRPTIQSGMTFACSEGPYHYFSLGHDHPGDEVYEGCSGAPILGDDGEPVALVVGWDNEKGLLRGVSLARYTVALDVAILQLKECT